MDCNEKEFEDETKETKYECPFPNCKFIANIRYLTEHASQLHPCKLHSIYAGAFLYYLLHMTLIIFPVKWLSIDYELKAYDVKYDSADSEIVAVLMYINLKKPPCQEKLEQLISSKFKFPTASYGLPENTLPGSVILPEEQPLPVVRTFLFINI